MWRADPAQIALRQAIVATVPRRRRSAREPIPCTAEQAVFEGTAKQLMAFVLRKLRKSGMPREEAIQVVVRMLPCGGCGETHCWFCYPGDDPPSDPVGC